MSFASPWMLLGLLVLPVLVVAHRRRVAASAARRRELAAIGFAAPPPRPGAGAGRTRDAAPLLLLAALALLVLALARPQATVGEPRREGTVVLAVDVSASMAATDLVPTRMEAAKAAARAFVERQPASVRIGVVAFSGSGVVTQQPTLDRAAVLAAVGRLEPTGGTALARGLQTSLSAIAGRPVTVDEPDDPDQQGAQGDEEVEPQGQDLGFFGDAAVVLLSDGENTGETDPLAVAEVASTAGIEVYPVGIGSPAGTTLEIDGFQVSTALDEALLREIAETTDGTYYDAADADELEQVYSSIDLAWTVERRRTEVTAWLAAFAGLLLLASVSISLARTGRVV